MSIWHFDLRRYSDNSFDSVIESIVWLNMIDMISKNLFMTLATSTNDYLSICSVIKIYAYIS